MVGPVGSSSTIPATCSPSASFEIFEMVIARGRRERERDLYIYIYIHICLCMCVYIYMHIHIMHYIWSDMVIYGTIHKSTDDSRPIFGFVQLYRYDTSMCQGAAASATSCRRPCAALGDLRGTSSAERDGHVTRRGDNGSYGLWKLKCLLIYGQQLLTNG